MRLIFVVDLPHENILPMKISQITERDSLGSDLDKLWGYTTWEGLNLHIALVCSNG